MPKYSNNKKSFFFSNFLKSFPLGHLKKYRGLSSAAGEKMGAGERFLFYVFTRSTEKWSENEFVYISFTRFLFLYIFL